MLVAASAALGLGHSSTPLALTPDAATRAVLHDQPSARALRALHPTRREVVPIDARVEQVTFYRGARVVFEAAVRADSTVQQTVNATTRPVPYGSQTAYRTGVLLGLGLIFVLVAAVLPLRRLRNLDVAALLSLTAPMILIAHRFVGASAIAGALPLAYLAARCGWVALGRRRPAGPSVPLYDAVTRGWTGSERLRVLRILAVAAVLVFVMVGVSSRGAVDVIYAVMEGATQLVHGVLPYGHLPGDVIHGDTYPILSYGLYAPVALLEPVGSLWDPVDLALAAGVLAALAAAACAAATGRTPHGRRSAASEAAALRGGLSLLCFPPLLAIVSTGTTDVALGAILALAIVLWRRPAASVAVLGVAGWFKLAPFVLLPIWLAPLRGRRLLAAGAALITLSVALAGGLLALGGLAGLRGMLDAISYQFSRGSFQSVWHTLGAESLQPYGEACVLALLAAAAVRLRSDRTLAADPRRIAALAGAALIGLQLAANYWAFLYLAWIAPLLVMSLLAEPAALGDGRPHRGAHPPYRGAQP
jgi:hypothetical protein